MRIFKEWEGRESEYENCENINSYRANVHNVVISRVGCCDYASITLQLIPRGWCRGSVGGEGAMHVCDWSGKA